MKIKIICDKCDIEITEEDDYGGMYVYDNGKYYHYICHFEYMQECVFRLSDLDR